MALRDYLDLDRPVVTWYAHALVTMAVGLAYELLFGLFAFGCWVAAAYFVLIREPADKRRAVEQGRYDVPVDGVTPRADYLGDVLGPLAVALGATLELML